MDGREVAHGDAAMAAITNRLADPEALENIDRIQAPGLGRVNREIAFFSAARTMLYASYTMELSLDMGATAAVILQRYWLARGTGEDGIELLCAAILYTLSKTIPSTGNMMPLDTRQLHSTFHLLSAYPHLPESNTWQTTTAIGEFFHCLQTLEHKISSTLGFDFAVNLPHSLVHSYLKILGFFQKYEEYDLATSRRMEQAAFRNLNTALLSPQLLNVTHQPYTLACAAIYLAASQEKVPLPGCAWWEVMDVDRESLGAVVSGILSVESWIEGAVADPETGQMRKDEIRAGIRGVLEGTDEKVGRSRSNKAVINRSFFKMEEDPKYQLMRSKSMGGEDGKLCD